MTIAQILEGSSLFKFLSDDQLKTVIQLGQNKSFVPGEEIYRHGQEAKTLYVLLNGAVSLSMGGAEEFHAMTEEIEKIGSVFGTAALTRFLIYSATAKCVRKATALALDSAGLQEIIRREPEHGLEVMAELAQLYSNRLNSARTGFNNLLRISRSQTHKAEIYEVYEEF